jgi:biotin transport system substrate-specific component
VRVALMTARSGLAVRWASLARDLFLVLVGSMVIGLSAQLAVYLPFTPVPISGQTFAILLVGASLGSRRGASSVLAYIVQGAVGFPVFAGGLAGLAVVLGPRGGYLFGMVLAAFVVGWLLERGWNRGIMRVSAAMILGSAAMYVVALPWLAALTRLDAPAVLALGFFPFVAGDAIKVALAAGGVPVAHGLIGLLRDK